MSKKIARFIKNAARQRLSPESAVPGARAPGVSPRPLVSRISPCVCRQKGDKWFCMKADHTGRFLLVDGPFDSEQDCINEAVCV